MRTRSLFLCFFILAAPGAVFGQAEGEEPAAAAAVPTAVPEVPSSCRADISYVLKRAEDKEESTYFNTEHASASSEPKARENLVHRILVAKKLAQDQCRARHENLSGCIGGKYLSNATLLERLEFKARKSLQDAIVADCERSQGTCLESVASAPECAPLPVAAEGEDAQGEKDKKEAPETKKAPAKKKK